MALPPKIGGGWAEQRALGLLRQNGWQMLDRNWHCRWGEIDLLLHKAGRLLLVEVKGRSSSGRDGWGLAAINVLKRKRLERAFSCWLAEHPHWQHSTLELVVALVPLPPVRRPVRWIRWGH
ncbi:YraN family protein [Cyanobium sp. HWJ4-Hawea]|uniref:YraN family protein n=1 Tax=unclassified Cyanobium TaxID=2627006 RepID=UPI0020CC8702|nr:MULTISPECIES: YraN family protein [unclassified Cyanobium]MCP9774630.1 YraN family protein [Cyanobium sp. WAJ14-Wanaka]MCP9808896.1 YraN family protein [Cyanobium sp. HWJ4-Hawea]